MSDLYNPGQEQASITASPNIQTVQAKYDPQNSANSLIAALGADSVQRGLADFQTAYNEKKLQEQSQKVDSYKQQFMTDHTGGSVSQAQLKERFPEMVPVIAARVAESIGRTQGSLDIAPIIAEINGNDSLRLDTTARAAYIAKAKADIFAKIPQGNEFFAAGSVTAVDRAFQQEELKWQGQTAAYHQEVQKTALSDEVVTALQGTDPTSALAAIDANWGKSSSLNNVERNKVYVDATIKLANISDDPTILQRIPQTYLNVDSKAALNQSGISLHRQQWARFTESKEFEAYQRSEADRKGMLEILNKKANNEDVDPAKYLTSPTLHSFALASMETPSIPEAASKATMQSVRTSILSAANVQTMGSQEDLTKNILSMRGKMNPKEMSALVDEVPKLMEGNVLMNDPNVRRAFSDHIGFRLDDLSKSTNPRLQLLLGTANIRGNATAMFEGEIRGNFEASYKDSGKWPQGVEARKIVDAAVAKTSAYIDFQTSLKSLEVMHPTPAAAAPSSAPVGSSGSPVSPVSLPKGVSLVSPPNASKAAPVAPAVAPVVSAAAPVGLPKGVTVAAPVVAPVVSPVTAPVVPVAPVVPPKPKGNFYSAENSEARVAAQKALDKAEAEKEAADQYAANADFLKRRELIKAAITKK